MTPAPNAVISVNDAQPAASHLAGLKTSPLSTRQDKASLAVVTELSNSTSVAVWSAGIEGLAPWQDVVIPEEKIGLLTAGHFHPFATAGRDLGGSFAGERRQITDVSVAAGQVVWTETASTDLAGNEWTIRDYNLTTHEVKDIAHSPYLKHGHRQAGPPGSTVPQVIGAYAYWATAVLRSSNADATKSQDWSWVIQRHRLDGRGRTQTIATNAAYAAAADGALFYATGGPGPGGATSYVIHRRVAGTGRDQQIVHGSGTGTARLSNVAAGDGQLVWTVSSPDDPQGWVDGQTTPGHIYVMDLASGRVTQIETKDEVGENYSIAFGPRELLWGNSSGNGDPSQYVLELNSRALYRLGATKGLSNVMASPDSTRISWQKMCPTKKEPARTCSVTAGWRR